MRSCIQTRLGVVIMVLVAFGPAVVLAGAPRVSAQESELPAWLVADARYEGVWKTVGANAAGDLDSQFTFGYPGADGSTILVPEEGKIAIRYGINPVGAANHSVTNIAATRTPDGFRFGSFDPGRNSAEFTCVISEDGTSLSCARHAMFNGREFFNQVEMTRVETGSGG
jgi:hypothetical protein